MKSVSVGKRPPSAAFSQLHAPGALISRRPCRRVLSKHRCIGERSCPEDGIAEVGEGRGGSIPAGLSPQAHELPRTFWFSVAARSQVHAPAGLAPINPIRRQHPFHWSPESSMKRERAEAYDKSTWRRRQCSQSPPYCKYSSERASGHRNIWPATHRHRWMSGHSKLLVLP